MSLRLPGALAVGLGPRVRGFFTTRAGGVSTGPYAAADGSGGLNLGLRVGDAAEAVRANRLRVAEAAGAPVAWMRQVHGDRVRHVAEGPEPAEARTVPGGLDMGECDALVAAPEVPVALAAMAADCLPLLLADADGRRGVAHVGRAGLLAGVVEAVVGALVELGAEPARLRAVLGPAVYGRCYEVPAELRAEVTDRHPAAGATTSWGSPAVDIPAAAAAALAGCGVTAVTDVGVCTLEDPRCYSHRRATREADAGEPPRTGRMAGVLAPAWPGSSASLAAPRDTPGEKPAAGWPLV